MRKLLITFVLLLTLFISTSNVKAATITSTSYSDGKFSIAGTGTDQVQIVIFDKSNKPVYMTTASASDGKFSITLPKISSITPSTYVVKVADYDGRGVSSKEVEVKEEKTPNTYDGINSSIIIGVICIIGIAGCLIYYKKSHI